MHIFFRKDEIGLSGNNYLVKKQKGLPIEHTDFIRAQNSAHKLSLLKKHLEKSDLIGKVPDKVEDVIEKALNEYNFSLSENYIKDIIVSPVKTPLQDKLKEEVMSKEVEKKRKESLKKVNELMQEFNVIKTFEEVGLYFNKAIEPVKLNKIYTVKEILEIVTYINNLIDYPQF